MAAISKTNSSMIQTAESISINCIKTSNKEFLPTLKAMASISATGGKSVRKVNTSCSEITEPAVTRDTPWPEASTLTYEHHEGTPNNIDTLRDQRSSNM